MPDFIAFGKLIVEKREQLHMTQIAFSKIVELSQAYVCQIENGKVATLSEKRISDMAQALDLDPFELCLLAGQLPKAYKEIIFEDLQLQALLKERLTARRSFNSKELA